MYIFYILICTITHKNLTLAERTMQDTFFKLQSFEDFTKVLPSSALITAGF